MCLVAMRAYVYVSLKKSVLDPQGKTIQSALKKMGYNGWSIAGTTPPELQYAGMAKACKFGALKASYAIWKRSFVSSRWMVLMASVIPGGPPTAAPQKKTPIRTVIAQGGLWSCTT